MHDHDDADLRGFAELLGERRWRLLATRGGIRHYKPGEALLRQGEMGSFLLVLLQGRVKVLAGDSEGSELLLSLRGPGDLVGEMAAGRCTPRTATVVALEKCTARTLTRAEFDRFLEEQGARATYADYLVGKLSETVPYQVQQVHFPPRQRLARLFLEVVRLADPNRPDCYRIPFSQDALAKALGLVRSTVAEQIRTMRADGVLTPGPRLVVANIRALADDARAVRLE
ncbi:cyclic nucleotide-binding domain-containing protein [Saccharopolyspora sp. ID03-671]|uniref:Crp/Fnr family transcriptional regulator n=1 Tax=Saccharopolyspora sp. ID03-671 TaxID=3073066 RepID=UPI003247E9E0